MDKISKFKDCSIDLSNVIGGARSNETERMDFRETNDDPNCKDWEYTYYDDNGVWKKTCIDVECFDKLSYANPSTLQPPNYNFYLK